MNKIQKYIVFASKAGRIVSKLPSSKGDGVAQKTRFVSSGFVTSCWKGQRLFVNKASNSNVNSSQLQRGFKRSTKSSIDSAGAQGQGVRTMSDNFNQILKPVLFTAFVGVSSITGCTIWQYEIYRSALLKDNRSLNQLLRLPSPPFGEKRGKLRQDINAWWNNMSAGEQIFWPICALNGLIYLAWRVPALSPSMVKWFSSNPSSRAVALPMLLSTFSHYSLYHLAANMFVLHSFAPSAANILGREQFLAMYLTAGTVASLGSHFHKLLVGSAIPSLGASGAIMAMLGLVCSNQPDTRLGIIFIPNINFSADTALKCIIAIDSFGIIAGWRFLDHAAHLSGCLFGVAYNYYAAAPLNAFRDMVTKHWHTFRTK